MAILESITPRRIFLIDGLGAMISAILLVAIASLESVFQFPEQLAYELALVALILSTYSMACYFVRPKSMFNFLLALVIANIGYSVFTGIVILYYWNTVSIYSTIYFISEILLILTLASIEFRMAVKKQP
ncbi:MAG: hypothetical protein Salg2KO_23030 [Salibacteraceae bacterium]